MQKSGFITPLARAAIFTIPSRPAAANGSKVLTWPVLPYVPLSLVNLSTPDTGVANFDTIVATEADGTPMATLAVSADGLNIWGKEYFIYPVTRLVRRLQDCGLMVKRGKMTFAGGQTVFRFSVPGVDVDLDAPGQLLLDETILYPQVIQSFNIGQMPYVHVTHQNSDGTLSYPCKTFYAPSGQRALSVRTWFNVGAASPDNLPQPGLCQSCRCTGHHLQKVDGLMAGPRARINGQGIYIAKPGRGIDDGSNYQLFAPGFPAQRIKLSGMAPAASFVDYNTGGGPIPDFYKRLITNLPAGYARPAIVYIQARDSATDPDSMISATTQLVVHRGAGQRGLYPFIFYEVSTTALKLYLRRNRQIGISYFIMENTLP